MVKETWENSSPLHIIDRIFEGDVNTYAETPNLFFEKCREYFFDDLKKFPSINSGAVNRDRFVRVRCMVQDVLGQEFFPIACKLKKDGSESHRVGFLRDSFEDVGAEIEPVGAHVGRHRYMMVKVPGETPWWQDEWNGPCGTQDPVEEKRTREDSFPLVVENFLAKIVTNEELLPNTVWDLFGILSTPVSLEGDEAAALPEIQHLHVLTHNACKHKGDTEIETDPSVVPPLLDSLTTAIGDKTAASYLLMNLVSTTYSRPGGMPICSMPLNICGVENSGPLVDAIKQLLPRVLHVPLTAALLSETPFAPVKDYTTDRLKQGLFQVANGTTVILDETTLPEGNIPVSNYAEVNCKTIERVLLTQQMEYDYGFYKLPFDVDMPIIILSKRVSRLVQTPWRVAVPPGISPALLGSQADLSRVRHFLQKRRAALKDMNIDPDAVKGIPDAFVEIASKMDPKKEDKGETLHQLLLLCRLLATLEGKDVVDLDCWHRVRALEKERAETLTEWAKNN